MKGAGRVVLAVAAGMALALALAIAVEMFSSMVHPIPAGAETTIPEHVRRYPGSVLALVVLMWGAAAGASTWVATRMGGPPAGLTASLLLLAALLFNLVSLPYPLWFKLLAPVAMIAANYGGMRYGARKPDRSMPS